MTQTGKISSTKTTTSKVTGSVQTMYPEAESNKTTTAANEARQETTTVAFPTTKRPLITRPTEIEIVPMVIIAHNFVGSVESVAIHTEYRK